MCTDGWCISYFWFRYNATDSFRMKSFGYQCSSLITLSIWNPFNKKVSFIHTDRRGKNIHFPLFVQTCAGCHNNHIFIMKSWRGNHIKYSCFFFTFPHPTILLGEVFVCYELSNSRKCVSDTCKGESEINSKMLLVDTRPISLCEYIPNLIGYFEFFRICTCMSKDMTSRRKKRETFDHLRQRRTFAWMSLSISYVKCSITIMNVLIELIQKKLRTILPIPLPLAMAPFFHRK